MLTVGPSQSRTPAELSETLESLSARVQPSVVQVFATGYAPGQGNIASGGGLLSLERGTGSGVIVNPAGYIVTNAHVVANAMRVQVELSPSPDVVAGRRSVLPPHGQLVPAQVVGTDRGTDLALLRVRVETALPALELGDSEALRPGELVMAYGSPLGLANSVSMGIVSAVARQVRVDDEMIRRHGRVRRGEIGVHAQTITPELASGLVLADVLPGGPADEAGLEIGDIVLALDGKVIENARQLRVNLFPRRVGEPVEMTGLRGDRQLTYSLSPVDRRSDPDRFERLVDPEQHLVRRLGILALNMTPEIAAMLPPLRRSAGVVAAVASAQSIPVRGEPLLPGDVIYALNGDPVGSIVGLRAALDAVAPPRPWFFRSSVEASSGSSHSRSSDGPRS